MAIPSLRLIRWKTYRRGAHHHARQFYLLPVQHHPRHPQPCNRLLLLHCCRRHCCCCGFLTTQSPRTVSPPRLFPQLDHRTFPRSTPSRYPIPTLGPLVSQRSPGARLLQIELQTLHPLHSAPARYHEAVPTGQDSLRGVWLASCAQCARWQATFRMDLVGCCEAASSLYRSSGAKEPMLSECPSGKTQATRSPSIACGHAPRWSCGGSGNQKYR